MPNQVALADTEENRGLLNPVHDDLLAITLHAKARGVNYSDYDSLKAFTHAYLSSLDTRALIFIKHALDATETPDEVLDAVLEARMMDRAASVNSI
ncbi:hypothetical protein [Sporosarcina sp. FSL K6-3457]|uniref:hypothetical protein n=1 Tax=Sporosarcina sp. FSL K6-3457 TaxID=2978204 RepID=UPI0030F60B0F